MLFSSIPVSHRQIPRYENPGGAISRRFVIFPFTTPVASRDTTLEKKIIDNELPTVMVRAIIRYHELQDLVRHIPPSILKGEEELYEETSELYRFLRHGNNYYSFTIREGAMTPLEELKTGELEFGYGQQLLYVALT